MQNCKSITRRRL